MTAVHIAVVLLAYASLLWELTVLHVPSAASSRNIWLSSPMAATAYSPPWRRVFGFSRPRKLALFILPVIVAWGVYVYPPIALLGIGDPLPDHLFAMNDVTNLASGMMIVLGRAITLRSVLSLRRENHESGSLTTDGLFRYSRNPGLLGMYVFASGLWLAAPSLTMLCGMVVYVLHMDFKVRMEEDYLENTIGDTYRSYQRRTPRYLS